MKYFTLNEFLRSDTALKNNIDNTPNPAILQNIKYLASVLDNIRADFGRPIFVNSGYRCARLNALVGGVPTSDHLLGCAADITSRSRDYDKELYALIKRKYPFNQLIWEGSWIHYSIYRNNKNQAF